MERFDCRNATCVTQLNVRLTTFDYGLADITLKVGAGTKMRISSVESNFATDFPQSFPVRLEQRTSPVSAVFFLTVLVPALASVLVTVGIFGFLVFTDITVRAAVVERSLSALWIAMGLGLWVMLWGIPAWTYVTRLGSRRSIEIGDGMVWVHDRTLWRKVRWSCALVRFEGLAHNIRTTHSGMRHELVLVHKDRAKSVLIHMAPSITDADMDRATAMLGHSKVSARALYGVRASVRAPDSQERVEALAA